MSARCRAPTARAPCSNLEIRIDAAGLRAARSRDPAKAPRLDLDPARLRQAIDDFHWALWDRDLAHFFSGEAAARDRLGKVMTIKRGDRVWQPEQVRADPGFLLLRVGRFGQFESKSVADVREGWNAQGKPPRGMREGNTRNLCAAMLGGKEARVPMGWLLCWGRMG